MHWPLGDCFPFKPRFGYNFSAKSDAIEIEMVLVIENIESFEHAHFTNANQFRLWKYSQLKC